jgi:fructose-specific phosphotransferase system component IIB
MAVYTRQPQRLVDWLAEGNALPEFAAGHIQEFLTAHGIDSTVSIEPDGTVTIETDATGQQITDALDGITADDIDPETTRRAEHAAIMAQLDAFADAVEAGQTPTAAQTQAAVARLVRVVQYVVARR